MSRLVILSLLAAWAAPRPYGLGAAALGFLFLGWLSSLKPQSSWATPR